MARPKTASPEDARREALETALATIERRYGLGSVMRLSDTSHQVVPVIPTGSIGLDLALGVGGIPRGRVTEIFGPESSGKTTQALHIIAEAQKRGGIAAFIDAEHALDINYARRLGVKTEDLLISQPDYGEQALEIADMLVRSGAVDVVVVDSVAALIPQAELEGSMGETQVGGQARLMSHAMRKLTGTIHKSRTSIVFINQLRGVSRNNLSGEYLLFITRYKPSYEEIKKVVYNSIRYSFLSESEKQDELKSLDKRFAAFEARIAKMAASRRIK